MNEFKNENKLLTGNILNHIFFKNWHYTNKNKGNFGQLELDVKFLCDLACKYCYVNNYSDILYPKELYNNETILNNTKAIIKWLIKNELNPTLNIFSGELFSQKIGFIVLNAIYDLYKEAPEYVRPKEIIIPSNFTFILSDELTNMVDDIRKKLSDINIRMILSASIEGKYMEGNRPFKNREKEVRDDNFYDKVFAYCKKYGYGFHPMVYSNNIEKWIDNFLWYQDMFKKHNINPFCLYLLEVRNAEWTTEQIILFQKFYDFIIKWIFNLVGGDNKRFIHLLFKHCGFNMVSSVLTTNGRGLGCSIQSTLYVRLGDLKIFPCHRTFYDHFQTAEFITDNDNNIIDINGINPELMLAVYSFQSNVAPYCASCLNKYFCSKGCLGSQFETTGDLFTPIPTVCQLEFAKTFQYIKTMKEIGVYDDLKTFIRSNQNIYLSLLAFEKLMCQEEYYDTRWI